MKLSSAACLAAVVAVGWDCSAAAARRVLRTKHILLHDHTADESAFEAETGFSPQHSVDTTVLLPGSIANSTSPRSAAISSFITWVVDLHGRFADLQHLAERAVPQKSQRDIGFYVASLLSVVCCLGIGGYFGVTRAVHALAKDADDIENKVAKDMRQLFDEACPEDDQGKYDSLDFRYECHTMFKAVDVHSKGQLSLSELRGAAEKYCGDRCGLDGPFGSALMQAFDADGDSVISEEEFFELMKWVKFNMETPAENAASSAGSAVTLAEDEPSQSQAQSDEFIRHLAELDCKPLLSCPAEERAKFKRKILFKWHPDKQPPELRELATRVMQECQNRPEWNE